MASRIPDKDVMALSLPPKIIERLLEYRQRFFDKRMVGQPDIDCAHFACFMGGIVVADWQHAMQALDIVMSQVVQPHDLPYGRIGVIGTTQDLREHEGFHHILHAGVSLGGGLWLNVTALGGNLAVSRIADDLAYQRAEFQQWYGHTYDPTSVQLHLGPDIIPVNEAVTQHNSIKV
jgi:hypothetical protein